MTNSVQLSTYLSYYPITMAVQNSLSLNTYVSMYIRTNRCNNKRGSKTNYVRSSIIHCTLPKCVRRVFDKRTSVLESRGRPRRRRIKADAVLFYEMGKEEREEANFQSQSRDVTMFIRDQLCSWHQPIPLSLSIYLSISLSLILTSCSLLLVQFYRYTVCIRALLSVQPGPRVGRSSRIVVDSELVPGQTPAAATVLRPRVAPGDRG